MIPLPPSSTLFPYTTLFRSGRTDRRVSSRVHAAHQSRPARTTTRRARALGEERHGQLSVAVVQRPRRQCGDRKSTRLNSSHTVISYAVFCLKKKKKKR